MKPANRKFMEKTFKAIKKEALELQPPYRLFIPDANSEYFDRQHWAVNAENAEKHAGIPQPLWDEATKAFRHLFGVNQLLETLFLLGFIVAWCEAKGNPVKSER